MAAKGVPSGAGVIQGNAARRSTIQRGAARRSVTRRTLTQAVIRQLFVEPRNGGPISTSATALGR